MPASAITNQQHLLNFNEPDVDCGIIGAKTVEKSKTILSEAEGLSYKAGGIAELKKMAGGGLHVFHVGFTNLDQGWQGSVTKESPDVHFPGAHHTTLFRTDNSQLLWSDVPSGLWGRGLTSKDSEGFCGLNMAPE